MGKIKCVVWDLDNTLWDGTLLEDLDVHFSDEIFEIIQTLDSRGILQSIASKNDTRAAMEKLKSLNIANYFLYPQINWNPKSVSIKTIWQSINIGMDTIAFIDDQDYELEEVSFFHPEVFCIKAQDIVNIINMPRMHPQFITDESKIRRKMYLQDIKRKKDEEFFQGPDNDFLNTLEMILTINDATMEDLKRAEELTVRTHQLNTTGYTYSYDDLKGFLDSSEHKLLVAGLDDKFGTYGKIGLILLETGPKIWMIKLFIISCRVMSRGVGSVLINYLRNEALKNKVRLHAEFIHTDVNRMMFMTYMFSHFKEHKKNKNLLILENDLTVLQEYPEYIRFG